MNETLQKELKKDLQKVTEKTLPEKILHKTDPRISKMIDYEVREFERICLLKDTYYHLIRQAVKEKNDRYYLAEPLEVRYLNGLYIKAVLFDTEYKTLYIINYNNNDYYIKDYNLYNLKDKFLYLQKIQKSIDFKLNINKILPEFKNIFKKYEGKKYGEKTKEKIFNELNAVSNKYNITSNIYTYDYINGSLNCTDTGKQNEASFTAPIDIDTNTIKNFDYELKKLLDTDPLKIYNKLQQISKKINMKSKEIIPLLNAYNEIQIFLNEDILNTYQFNLKKFD